MDESKRKINKYIFIGIGVAAVVLASAAFFFNKQLANRSLSHFYSGKAALGRPAAEGPTLYPNADYQKAIGEYKQAISYGLKKVDKDLYAEALNDLGFSYWMLKEKDRAVEKYLEYISAAPDKSFAARYFVGYDYFNRLNKPKEALDVLIAAPNMATASIHRKNLFRVYSLLGRLALYFEDFNNARKYADLAIGDAGSLKDIDIRNAHSTLAVLAGMEGDFVAAALEVKKADALAGPSGSHQCILASAYLAGENYSKAISVALKARAGKIAKTYLDSICLQVLVNSYLAQGDKTKAKQYLQEYLSFTEGFAEKNIFVARYRQQFADELQKFK